MYDIKIFLEDNGKFGAVASLGKEKVYGIGGTQKELIQSLKNGISLSNEVVNSSESKKIESFLEV